jgi:aspartate aminotransferase-like enzyme
MTTEDIWPAGLTQYIEAVNRTAVFTPGPASLCSGNLAALGPAFGRGDAKYDATERAVLGALLQMTGHERIARMQGSATLALEIAARNFVFGRVLVISSGYYADRLSAFARMSGEVVTVDEVGYERQQEVSGRYDWVMACYVETSRAQKFPMIALRSLADRLGARLYVDATASIGLEDGHELSDVVAYSSCKGLCGLTGAAFVAFNGNPVNEVDSFYLDLRTHLEKRVTGPYHVIQSLASVLQDHAAIRFAVSENKAAFMRRFGDHSPVPAAMQPQLCTHVLARLAPSSPALMYEPRAAVSGSIVCHLGEAHLGRQAKGELVDILSIS